MRPTLHTLPFMATFALVACSSTPRDLSKADTLDVCRSYGVYRTGLLSGLAPEHRRELESRKAISASDWALVDAQKIQVGMSTCALYASWGAPSRENRSVGAFGTRIQHIYNAGLRYVRPTYVYTNNGTVSSWQD